MIAIEREILKQLFTQAAKYGFSPVRFAEQPGNVEDAIEDSEGLTVEACITFADERDADSIVDFRHEDGRAFWVVLVWGNGEDVISDYLNTVEANSVADCVYAWIEGKEKVGC